MSEPGKPDPGKSDPDTTAFEKSVAEKSTFEQYERDLRKAERRVAGEIDPGARAVVVAVAVVLAMVSMVLPHTGSVTGLEVLSFTPEAAAERVATQLAAANGLKLTRLDLRLSPAGANGVAVVVDAQVKKSLLSATVEASMTATVDDALGVTLSDVKVTSRNPVVVGLLVAARSRVERFDGRRIDLVSALPAGIRLADVRVTVGDEVVLTARAE